MTTPTTDDPYQYTIKDLLQAFQESGLQVSRMWIHRQEQKGNLIIPKSTTNFKRSAVTHQLSPIRVLNQATIDGILKAFLPGGTGYYDYRKHGKENTI